jgi:hypothetical protein
VACRVSSLAGRRTACVDTAAAAALTSTC